MKETDILRFVKQLNKEVYVKQMTAYISKAQVLKEQTEAMGTDPAEFGHNVVYGFHRGKLNADYANSATLHVDKG